jgi:hypothetical protein
MITKRYWLWLSISLITVILTIMALWRSQAAGETALAQEGGGETSSNGDSIQEILQSQPAGDTVIVTSEAIGPQSDNSGIEVIPSAAFRHDGNNANGWVHWFANGYLRNNSSQFACFMAPTYPPAGATLTRFSVAMRDNHATEDLGVGLYRVPLTNSGPSELLAATTPVGLNSPNVVEASDITIEPGKTVVSHSYAYYVAFCFRPDTSTAILFYGARLFYTP